METIFLFILYPLILIAQIAYLVIAVKKNKSSHWLCLFTFDILMILFAGALMIYFSRTLSHGIFGSIGESFISILMLLSFLLSLFVTSCAKIITFELNLKKQGRNYVNPFCLILATCFIFVGVFTSGCEFLYNLDLEKTTGTVLSIEPTYHWGESVEESTIEYEVNNEKYEDKIITRNEKVGDKIEVYYHKYRHSYDITYPENTKVVYIPAYIIGIFTIIFRLIVGFNLKEESTEKIKRKEKSEK